MAKSAKHPGFKAAAAQIAKKSGYSKERASAILAASTRKAIAKGGASKNKNLLKVKGK